MADYLPIGGMQEQSSVAHLNITTADGRTFRRVIDKDVLTVGRSSKNDINLTIDGSLSRQHAEILREGEKVMVRDVGSRNGTSVNGVPVVQPVSLKPGDRITLGETTIVFGEGAATQVVIEDSPVAQETTTYTMSVDEVITHSNVFGGASETRPAEAGLKSPVSAQDAASEGGHTMAILSRAGMELINNRPLPEIPNFVMDLVFEAIPAERGFLMLLEGEGEEQEMVQKAVRDLTRASGGAISLSRSIAKAVIEKRQSILTRDAQTDERFKMRESVVLQGIRSAMCAPLWNNKEVMGLIYVDTVNSTQPFSAEDLRLVTLLANIAAVKLENARLVEEEKEKELMEVELQQAADIQNRLLPSAAPTLDKFQVCGRAMACRSVGGDYYDFVTTTDQKVGLALGDVSGKGMAAALLMASVQAIFRTLASVDSAPASLVTALNKQLLRSSTPNKFVSFFYGKLDQGTGHLRYVNAGHNPPILVRAGGEVETLDACGVVLGVFGEAAFEEREVTLEPGDLLALFSDGITEAQDLEGNMFGEEKLTEVLSAHRTKGVREIENTIFDEVAEFAGEAPQYDDATLMILRREG